MNKQIVLMASVSATLIIAAIVSAVPLQNASAKITETTTCDGPGKSCDSQGNAQESNPNVEESCTATNSGSKNHEPPGRNPC